MRLQMKIQAYWSRLRAQKPQIENLARIIRRDFVEESKWMYFIKTPSPSPEEGLGIRIVIIVSLIG